MNGRIALVTGGSRGIGRAIALKHAQEGCDVAILYAGRKEAADETVSLLTAAGARALAARLRRGVPGLAGMGRRGNRCPFTYL